MFHQGIQGIPYYLGIRSLADMATREDRVCVLNVMGGESRTVTPTSHAFSGGNVVFGTSPGRAGQRLKTPAGDIPVFNNVREGLDAGLAFNTGVVYLPPSGVRDGVAELVRVNPDLRKIVIITEKIAVHDAREIRAMAQANGVDIIGGNCLGVADSWNRVRIGGALGGDHPGGVAPEGVGGDLLELRRLHHHDRAVSRHRGLGHDDADLERQGRLHPLRRPGFRARVPQRRPLEGGGALRRARRLLRARGGVGEAGRRLRRRALEVEADARGRPCRRDGGLRRPGRGQGTLVHGGVRGRLDLHAREPRRCRAGARWSPTSPTFRRR